MQVPGDQVFRETSVMKRRPAAAGRFGVDGRQMRLGQQVAHEPRGRAGVDEIVHDQNARAPVASSSERNWFDAQGPLRLFRRVRLAAQA